MTDEHSRTECRGGRHDTGPLMTFLRRWFAANSILAGILALVWLVLRSGTKPSRLAYPCQQAAASTALLALASPIAATIITLRNRVVAGLRTRAGVALMVLAVVAPLGVWGARTRLATEATTQLNPPAGYRATVYQVTDCPEDLVGDRFPGVDNLIELMGENGLKFYETPETTTLSGPDGIIGPDDVVVIKINYQWSARGGTNTDVLMGLMRAIVDHPSGFTGEIVIGENGQVAPLNDFDRTSNNAQDRGQSPLDVVNHIVGLGYRASVNDWGAIRFLSVPEYSQGSSAAGYVVYDFESRVGGRLSYPKFTTPYGTAVSLRDGIWLPAQGTYDRERLKFINLPVLKSHSAVYGATACVKNYMGVVTNEQGTDSHAAVRVGMMGGIISELGLADLNILDCIWINGIPLSGPATYYLEATRANQLVASIDPVAADMWAVTNILVPAFIANGYPPPWENPNPSPFDPTGEFRMYLDNSMQRLLEGGHAVTNNIESIDAFTWDGTRTMTHIPRRTKGRRAQPRPVEYPALVEPNSDREVSKQTRLN